jgi:hypothetical protein
MRLIDHAYGEHHENKSTENAAAISKGAAWITLSGGSGADDQCLRE